MRPAPRLYRPPCQTVLGMCYGVSYVEHGSQVDQEGAVVLWGQVDYIRRQIRVLLRGQEANIRHTLAHELVHALTRELTVDCLESNETDVDLLAGALADCLDRNRLGAWTRGKAMRPKQVIIFGKVYRVVYGKNPFEVEEGEQLPRLCPDHSVR